MSSKTCIIGGGAAGSHEHVFPAALGGRRTNKGIYCGVHNNAYSGLAAIMTEQLRFFNARLGVVGDHADDTKPVIMKDTVTDQDVEVSKSGIRLVGPFVVSSEIVGQEQHVGVIFNDTDEANAWLKEQRAKGLDIRFDLSKTTTVRTGVLHKTLQFGGTEEGLRAVGYIGQTFLAHNFPELARRPEMQGFKDYTLKNIGSGFVWWDFDQTDELPPNKFPFGHRIIVGQDKSSGVAYARISFFSTLNFAMIFAAMPVAADCTKITDIDPLADNPPDDIAFWTENAAINVVAAPSNLTASLSEAIKSGKAEKKIGDLVGRIQNYIGSAA